MVNANFDDGEHINSGDDNEDNDNAGNNGHLYWRCCHWQKLRSERLAAELDSPYSLLGLGVCRVAVIQVDLFRGRMK